jgi:hypothetical protein
MMRSSQTRDPVVNRDDSSGLRWEGFTPTRIRPGLYQGFCSRWQGPEWVRAFRRWSIRFEFILLDGETVVSVFYNLGSNPAHKSYGRRSRFYKDWCRANGEPPCKGQRMTYATFTEPGLLYTVRVADATKDERQAEKPDALVYSRVTEIIRVERK